MQFSGIKILNKDPELLKTDDAPQGELCYWFKKPGHKKFFLDVDITSSMIHRLDFLTKEVTLFKCPENIGKYVGSNFKLYGVSLEEWILIDQKYIGFAKTKDLKFLDSMHGVLYHLPGEKWDESADLTERSKRFSKMPPHIRYVVFLWYTSCKLWLKVKYPFLFTSDGTGDSTLSANDYVMGLLTSLNEGNVSNNPVIKRLPCHEVFYELNRKIEKSKTF